MATKPKFKDTIVTEAGRKLLLEVGDGEDVLHYTRAGIYTQSVEGMDDYDIRQIKGLTGEQMSVGISSVSSIENNTITIEATFSNADVDKADLEFNCIGWYAKIDSEKEELIGITPTNGTLVLAAHAPGNVSTESINIDFNMAISNSANVDMTVSQAGVVREERLQAELTKVKDGIDKEIANYYNKTDIDNKLKNLGGVKSVNGTKPDASGNVQISVDATQQINNITYNKTDIDKKISTKADSSSVYTKTDVDSRVNAKANSADVYTKKQVDDKLATKADKSTTYTKAEVDSRLNGKADKSTTYTKTDVDSKFTPVNNKLTDYENRIKYIEENAAWIKEFTDENQAKEWSKNNHSIGIIIS